ATPVRRSLGSDRFWNRVPVLARLETGVMLRARASREVFLTAARQCGPASAVVGSIVAAPESGTRGLPWSRFGPIRPPPRGRPSPGWFAVGCVPRPGHAPAITASAATGAAPCLVWVGSAARLMAREAGPLAGSVSEVDHPGDGKGHTARHTYDRRQRRRDPA